MNIFFVQKPTDNYRTIIHDENGKIVGTITEYGPGNFTALSLIYASAHSAEYMTYKQAQEAAVRVYRNL